jgi:NhaP-type Na+/H+ or K+/H+ antiporter
LAYCLEYVKSSGLITRKTMVFRSLLGLVILPLLFPYLVQADPAYADHDREIIILFMFGGMALGVLVTHLLSRFPVKLPYTVVIFIIGCAFASLYTNENMGHVGQSLDDWSKLDPELMLYLFLPVLIFGEAMTLKW